VGAFGLALSLAAPAGADSAARPFNGRASGEAQFVPKASCAPFGMSTQVDRIPGRAMHLGRMTMSSEHCSAVGPIGPGTMTLYAANGDQVKLEYTGFAPPPAPEFDVTSDATIVGGTGRFEDATGHLHMTAHVVFQGFEDPSWPITFVWTGTIAY
jgi:hypothetical protein